MRNRPPITAKRASLADRRQASRRGRKPRTRPVPHPFLLPYLTVK